MKEQVWVKKLNHMIIVSYPICVGFLLTSMYRNPTNSGMVVYSIST